MVKQTARRCGTWLRNEGSVQEDQREDDHDDARGPGDDVEAPGVGVLAHQIAAIDQDQNEDEDDRQPDAVAYLRINQNFPERRLGNEHDARADHDERGVKRIKCGSFFEFAVETGFEAKAFADDVRR